MTWEDFEEYIYKGAVILSVSLMILLTLMLFGAFGVLVYRVITSL